MCTSYTYTNTCMPRFGPSEPSRCLIPTPGLTSEYSVGAMCVCVCVYTHIHPHTLPSALNLKNREDTDNTHIFPSAKEQTPTPSNKGFHRRAETPYPHSPMLNETNCTCMCAYAHPVASVQQMCMLMFTRSVYRTHLHMHNVHNTCECIHTLCKNAHGLVTRACALMQQYKSFFALEAIANLP